MWWNYWCPGRSPRLSRAMTATASPCGFTGGLYTAATPLPPGCHRREVGRRTADDHTGWSLDGGSPRDISASVREPAPG